LSELPHATAALLGLTFGLWLATEWLLFTLRYRFLKSRLICTRELTDQRGRIDTLWAKRSFQVRTELRLRFGLRLPLVRISDLLPSGADQTAGEPQYEGPLEPGQPVALEYRLQWR